jgi:hypothetical protein
MPMLPMLVAMMVQAPTPSAAALELARRLAAHGALAMVAPMMAEKDLADLASEDPTLTTEQKARLLAIGHTEARTALDRLTRTLGVRYAAKLSIADLRTLVAQTESPAAARLRAIQPGVVAETMTTIGTLDLKKQTAAAFCKESGKLCDRK